MGYLYLFMAILVLIVIGLTLFMYKEAHTDRTLVQKLPFENLPPDFGELTIFFISDIHKRLISHTIIERIIGKAEIVIIGGDLAEKGVGLDQVKENLTRLKQVAPLYFVWGNNDYELDPIKLKELMVSMDVTILDNSSVQLKTKTGSVFALIGVDDYSVGQSDLEVALEGTSRTPLKILVSHNPEIMNFVTPEHHIQLVLSGHTHGGQIRFLGLGLYELGGIKRIGKSLLFVSNGYGTTSLPLRLGAKAETHLLTIDRS
ncbi:Predicted phosphohydrolase, MPP superfamily [Mesobacillus persicus]|uniref:Predicted phosphohydrolase, MPP superfamily n=1 Tax=Mesobacillus persicus TaxID=930146 RepID=A0A1H8BST4_9BACI|nr:metallophosphoesterase [Mesobacillus persicus]SEM85961.1 Predicted phosphohydrolase, MPP superfamily [Mesobacillus persicus]